MCTVPSITSIFCIYDNNVFLCCVYEIIMKDKSNNASKQRSQTTELFMEKAAIKG